MLIGPLAHIRTETPNGIVIYSVDWSRPGAVERFNAEEKEWWDTYPDPWKGKFPGP